MRGSGGAGGQPMSRGARILAAVVVGVTLGCVCAFLYPDGLIPRSPDSALHWPRRFYSDSCPQVSLKFSLWIHDQRTSRHRTIVTIPFAIMEHKNLHAANEHSTT
ncbi:hypothetical protein PR202_gb29263 [Eleusine coracana subsp. coracana]|uniref:Uncharacterized protein n=1 Tax=Eleusine coracana subsp. coracana TaxID=191504 RepID=A0AAV5FZW3_ELECO|nr:hypothetical protein PR202_gb29263 [Eleusine coracana subsp. coracana]